MVHVVLAGGGSAGHTSPLIATAERLLERDGVSVSCIGTADKLEAVIVPAAGLEIDFIDRVPMPRRPSKDLLLLPGHLGRAVAQCREILRRRRADVLVGFGGYVCPPAYLAARSLGVPYVVHEGNTVAGLANKLGARGAAVVATTYSVTSLPRAETLGLPLRRRLTDLDRAAERATARATLGLPAEERAGERPTLLVSGGSLGARSINDAVTAVRDQLLAGGADVIHVWGKTNVRDDLTPVTDPTTGAVYRPLAYVDDMAVAYAAADLMLCRAGSNTVMEVAVVGLPAVFVPLPHGNGEQAVNAAELVKAGGGLLVADAELTAERVAGEVAELLHSPERLAHMAKAGRALVPSDAAERLAARALEVAR